MSSYNITTLGLKYISKWQNLDSHSKSMNTSQVIEFDLNVLLVAKAIAEGKTITGAALVFVVVAVVENLDM